jgi:ABC-type multidrug transport system ATPase subunit
MELAKLSVCLGKREILTDHSVELSGRTIGLLGANGAGKSILILTLPGFCPVTRGTARVLGHDIRRHIKQVSALVGYP